MKNFTKMAIIAAIVGFTACGNAAEPPEYERQEQHETAAQAQLGDISDDDIHEKYQNALEAISWFEVSSTILGEWLMGDNAIVYNENIYNILVIHDKIYDMQSLLDHLYSIFTPDFVEDLLLRFPHLFIERDGRLFTQARDRGTNIFAGEIRHEILRFSDYIIYRVEVDIHDESTHWNERTPENAIYVEISDFRLVNIDGVWLFENFRTVV